MPPYDHNTFDEELIQNTRDGNHEKVRELLRMGADVNASDIFGATCLIRASFNGRLNVVRELLKHDNVHVNAEDSVGDTPLIIAVREGHVEVVIELLKHDKVDVNVTSKSVEASRRLGSIAGRSDISPEWSEDDSRGSYDQDDDESS